MKITVLNGSPKVDSQSVTMQYIKFLQKKYPSVDFKILNIGQKSALLEKNATQFEEVIQEIANSDGVIWAFPLYYLLVASQMKRFIELIFSRKAEKAFISKPAAILATSIHFFDNLAINYMHEISDDLQMNYFDSFSASMFDLTLEKERKRLTDFGRNFLDFIKKGTKTNPINYPIVKPNTSFNLAEAPAGNAITNKSILILTDAREEDSNLQNMTRYLNHKLGNSAKIINLNEVDIKGGCLGCIRCAHDFTCVYKDGIEELYKNQVMKADIIIFAGSVKDRYLSWKWKQFFDRSFGCTNHTPSLTGKQLGMLISGPFRQMHNLRTLFESYTEVQGLNLVSIVSDDYPEASDIENALSNLADSLIRMSEQSYVKGKTFLGVGSLKIFRDDIYSTLRYPFTKDFENYKKLGMFDFPQKQHKYIIINTVLSFLAKFPAIRKNLDAKGMEIGIIQPFQKVIQATEAVKYDR